MKVVAFDTETNLIRPGRTAPPISCLSFQIKSDVKLSDPALVHWTKALPLVRAWLLDKDTILVGHNVAFDLAVLGAEWPDLIPLIFAAYEGGRITDTMLRQKLLDIADGCYRGYYDVESQQFFKLGYTLLELAKRCAGVPIKKEGFRLFYGPLRDVPLEDWVEGAKALQVRGRAWLAGEKDDELEMLAAAYGDREKFRDKEGVLGMVGADPNEVITYPLDDARSTMAVYLAQENSRWTEEGAGMHARDVDLLLDQSRQAQNAWWKHLTSAWGLRTNGDGVAALQMHTQRVCDELQEMLVREGLVRQDGSRDTTKAKERMLRVCGWQWDVGAGKYVPIEQLQLAGECLPLRLTPSGEPQLDADACKATEDDVLVAYAELQSLKTVLNKDVPALARGTIYPVHTHFDIAETGRSTTSNPNVQNWRRLPGIRECFVPRKGRVFAQADYSGLELCTLAQACLDLLNESVLAEALNAGKDPHTDLAALIAGVTYEEGVALRKTKDHEFDNARQTAKVANFGFPGGLGAAKLVLFARKTYGVNLGTTEEQAIANARALKRVWLSKWPEMASYFDYVNSLPEGERGRRLEQLRSKRVRGGVTYTAACNSFFQGLGADATGYAGWLICKACYDDCTSPLFGGRIVNYVHDEFIVEVDESAAAEAAEELSRLMVKGAKVWIPDVAIAAEPCLMTVWSKDAKTLRDATGRLVPWSPTA